jgi:hypothetical protein
LYLVHYQPENTGKYRTIQKHTGKYRNSSRIMEELMEYRIPGNIPAGLQDNPEFLWGPKNKFLKNNPAGNAGI